MYFWYDAYKTSGYYSKNHLWCPVIVINMYPWVFTQSHEKPILVIYFLLFANFWKGGVTSVMQLSLVADAYNDSAKIKRIMQ